MKGVHVIRWMTAIVVAVIAVGTMVLLALGDAGSDVFVPANLPAPDETELTTGEVQQHLALLPDAFTMDDQELLSMEAFVPSGEETTITAYTMDDRELLSLEAYQPSSGVAQAGQEPESLPTAGQAFGSDSGRAVTDWLNAITASDRTIAEGPVYWDTAPSVSQRSVSDWLNAVSARERSRGGESDLSYPALSTTDRSVTDWLNAITARERQAQ